MKFAQSLNENSIPEWRSQYLDYKQGKKRLKKLDRSPVSFIPGIKSLSDHNSPLLKTPKLPKTSKPKSHSLNDDFQLPSPALESNSQPQDKPAKKTGSESPNPEDTTPLLNHKTPDLRRRAMSSRRQSQPQSSEKDFISWVDSELAKVNNFYKEKEQDSLKRFLLLQDQINQLHSERVRNKQKFEYLRDLCKNNNEQNKEEVQRLTHWLNHEAAFMKESTKKKMSSINNFELPSLPKFDWLRQKQQPSHAELQIDANGNVVSETLTEEDASVNTVQARQARTKDFSKKKQNRIPYIVAKKQLKRAILSFYRSLELLSSFRTLNRTAFRKMLKKYDKATGSNELPTYMSKVDASYFVQSDVLDSVFVSVENLYSKTYQHGNKKIALQKLRSQTTKNTFYGEFFSSGVMLGCAIPLFIISVYLGLQGTLSGRLAEGKYMLQIWGGFFMPLLIALLFGVNCYFWTRFKINYKFIFEFNKNNLDYRQYFLLPSFLFLVLTFTAWFAFHDFYPNAFPGRHWIWIFVGVALTVILCPFDMFHRSARFWLLAVLWRLIFSGLYPVEFADFFLGDILCSLTYSMGNISFFICLYATHWKGGAHGEEASRCSSSNSRLMGFLETLPPIWRFLQCGRRYADTGSAFPHLANMGKYSVTAVYYMLLSIYRINRIEKNRILFTVFAAINSIYSATWDVFVDWSLVQFGSKNYLLRDDLAVPYKPIYYAAIVFDVVLRFQWIFYSLFSRQIQQSAATSFCVGVAEILRRCVWVFFRMENEHCTNVKLFRAYKETPLPYLTEVEEEPEEITPIRKPSDEEATVGVPESEAGPKRRRVERFASISNMLTQAHARDFQRRESRESNEHSKGSSDEDGDDADEDTDDDVANEFIKHSTL